MVTGQLKKDANSFRAGYDPSNEYPNRLHQHRTLDSHAPEHCDMKPFVSPFYAEASTPSMPRATGLTNSLWPFQEGYTCSLYQCRDITSGLVTCFVQNCERYMQKPLPLSLTASLPSHNQTPIRWPPGRTKVLQQIQTPQYFQTMWHSPVVYGLCILEEDEVQDYTQDQAYLNGYIAIGYPRDRRCREIVSEKGRGCSSHRCT